MADEYEVERSVNRAEAATLLHGLADGVAAGAVSLQADDGERRVAVPEEFDLELEFESGDDEQGLEVELEWATDAVGDGHEEATPASDEDVDDASTDADTSEDIAAVVEPAEGAAAQQASLGRFELYEDRGGEWRWRLVHRNGNVVATSGEGYTRKHNARKGLRSVMRNAPGATVTERPDE